MEGASFGALEESEGRLDGDTTAQTACYGYVTSDEVLEELGIHHAQALVVTVNDLVVAAESAAAADLREVVRRGCATSSEAG